MKAILAYPRVLKWTVKNSKLWVYLYQTIKKSNSNTKIDQSFGNEEMKYTQRSKSLSYVSVPVNSD